MEKCSLEEDLRRQAGRQEGLKRSGRRQVGMRLGVGREPVKKGSQRCLVQLQLCLGSGWDPKTCKQETLQADARLLLKSSERTGTVLSAASCVFKSRGRSRREVHCLVCERVFVVLLLLNNKRKK